MLLPPLVSFEDFTSVVPGGVQDSDTERAVAVIGLASTEVRAFTQRGWVDDDGQLDLPTGTDAWMADVLVKTTITAALRAFTNPEGVTSTSLGIYSEAIANSSPDVYLTSSEQRDLRRVTGQPGGIWAQPMTRGPLETQAVSCYGGTTEYVSVDPPGQDLPFSGPDGY